MEPADIFAAIYILLAIIFVAMAFVQVGKPGHRSSGLRWLWLAFMAVLFNVPNFIPTTQDNNIRIDLVLVDFMLLPLLAIRGWLALVAEYRRYRAGG